MGTCQATPFSRAVSGGHGTPCPYRNSSLCHSHETLFHWGYSRLLICHSRANGNPSSLLRKWDDRLIDRKIGRLNKLVSRRCRLVDLQTLCTHTLHLVTCNLQPKTFPQKRGFLKIMSNYKISLYIR